MNNKDYYMPAEWEQHERTFIEWPVKSSMVSPENYTVVCEGYAETAGAIAEFEPVTMIVNEDTLQDAKALCGSGVEYLTIPHDDAWCRDNGPIFLINGDRKLSALNWQFNAWGGKYPCYELDNEVAPRLLEYYGVAYRNVPMVLEGGSIHVDGQGTLLTTRECLLNKNRNPHMTAEQIEANLEQYLGIRKTLWLNRGLWGDETDGHVDNAACFARPGVILMQTCKDPEDPNYEISRENIELLNNSRDALGRELSVIEIPQPPARYLREDRLTLSYLNFYFVNGGIILPVFGGDAMDTDRKAQDILQSVFPERRIKTVDGIRLITEGGNVHCITQQMPLVLCNP